jgi:hypothetical protein
MDAIHDIQFMSEDERFAIDQMIVCESCSRSNPPNRTSCLYCGKPFQGALVSGDFAKINYQRPEAWEDGFSLVYAGENEVNEGVVNSASELLKIEAKELRQALEVHVRLPLIYLRSLTDAGLLASRLSNVGFDCAIVGDDLLQARVLPTRVRSMVSNGDEFFFEDFNTSKMIAVKRDDRVLLVPGTLLQTSTEMSGKITKKTLKTTDESLASFDEAVIDIYPPNDVYGMRIRSSGFDFSCLGDQKQPIAGANMAALMDMFLAQFSSAIFIDQFKVCAPLIDTVWPVSSTKHSSSVTRGPLGGIRKHSVTVVDNTIQFTKFSRLQRYFI